MAPSTRARRRADITTPQPSTATCGDPVTPPPDTDDGSDGRKSRHVDRELDRAGHPKDHRLWTPEPEPYDDEKYAAWGQKHYGADWHERRKTMLEERNIYKLKHNDFVYLKRQRALRQVEREREKGKLAEKGKTWSELMIWARKHYGDDWYEQREALLRGEDRSKRYKRREILRQMERERDTEKLTEGKTWHKVMASPASPSNALPPVETGIDIESSPSNSSEDSDSSGYSTYPPTDDEPRQVTPGPDDRWERLEWIALRNDWTKKRYQEEKLEIADDLKSQREDEACKRRELEEVEAIRQLQWTDHGEYDRQMRHHNLRIEGYTQERIEEMDREAAARWERRQREPPPARSSLFGRPITQGERDASAARLREDRVKLARLVAQHERELVTEPGATADAPVSESVGASQPQTSLFQPTEDISRKTRGGRITKNAIQNQSGTRKNIRSRRPAPTSAEALIPDRQPKRFKEMPATLDEPVDSPTPAQRQPRRRQCKAYEEKRTSRRLAGQSPEFGMLLGRGEAPPHYEATLQQPSDIRKTSRSGKRRSTLSAGPTVKGAKPQGVLRSRQAKTSRPKSRKGPLSAG
ncbi:hypothetical protein BU26DRAFT_570949 [Trematosphaeria pertusa]|uniref:Uncharacterized protein n=1 Tax=Trematosphaeria pertusa TaxID=390896 RepID=A0A6A6HXD9_9PLEO|nr:uncharacterized protein BU26DRAFT_570949 [Trematosphaeria pertusa]KAF2242263.1 hypothetical protein BU26DRAFT_570949 [Trematosphaeria pertusa]